MFYNSQHMLYIMAVLHILHVILQETNRKGGIWPLLLKSAAVCFVGHGRISTVLFLRKTVTSSIYLLVTTQTTDSKINNNNKQTNMEGKDLVQKLGKQSSYDKSYTNFYFIFITDTNMHKMYHVSEAS